MKLILLIFGLIAAATADKNVFAKRLSHTNKQLTAKLLPEVLKQHYGPVVLSAYSLLTPLALLSRAAVLETRNELLNVLDLPDDVITRLSFSVLNNFDAKGVVLKAANKIYVADQHKLSKKFKLEAKWVFGSEVENVNFRNSENASKKINNWVKTNTNGLVKDLVRPDSLDVDTNAVLVNALYFKGSWQEKFNKNHTRYMNFYYGQDFHAPRLFMMKTSNFLYGRSDSLQATLLQLPFEGGETSLLVVLPYTLHGLNDLQKKLLKNPELLVDAVSGMTKESVSVVLPKFKVETTTDLKKALKNLGVNQLFDPNARLDNLLSKKQRVYVDKAVQKVVLEIDEDGGESASVNSIELVPLQGPYPNPPNVFQADRPFYYELRHKNEALFSGVYRIPIVPGV